MVTLGLDSRAEVNGSERCLVYFRTCSRAERGSETRDDVETRANMESNVGLLQLLREFLPRDGTEPE